MGILNVTPDSFSDGGLYHDVDKAVAQARQMIKEGADIIDIGGESTRPGSDEVSANEEIERVVPVIKQLRKLSDVPLSIDSMKPEVVEQALNAGATMVNDVTGLQQDKMIDVVAANNVPVVIMHMQGKPKTMQENPQYENVIEDIKRFFAQQIAKAQEKGIQQIILDPGIGFGKTVEHNLTIFKYLNEFTDLGYPLLIGPSRKSFIEKVTQASIDQRLPGTLASVAISVLNGASIVRVHDVQEAKQAIQVALAIKEAT